MKIDVTTLACAAALAAASGITPAHAKEAVAMIQGTMRNGKLILSSYSRSAQKYTYDYTTDVPYNKETLITGWTLYNTGTCAEITEGKMKAPKKNPDKNGTWTVGTLTGAYNSACPGDTFTYASISYTWTNKKVKAGRTDKGVAVWTALGGKGVGTYVINNVATNVYTK